MNILFHSDSILVGCVSMIACLYALSWPPPSLLELRIAERKILVNID